MLDPSKAIVIYFLRDENKLTDGNFCSRDRFATKVTPHQGAEFFWTETRVRKQEVLNCF